MGKKPCTINAAHMEGEYCIARKYSGLVQRLNLKEIRYDNRLEAEDDTGKIVLKGKTFNWIPDPPLSEEEQRILDIMKKII